MGKVHTNIGVLRSILSTRTNDNGNKSKRASIFYTFIPSKRKIFKLVIDIGNSMNVVFNSTINKLHLKPEPQPHPFRVAWDDKTSLSVTKRCLVLIKVRSYSEDVYWDVLLMDVAHVVLGRPWLYDHDVMHCGRENTSVFSVVNKSITLQPAKPFDKLNHNMNILVFNSLACIEQTEDSSCDFSDSLEFLIGNSVQARNHFPPLFTLNIDACCKQ